MRKLILSNYFSPGDVVMMTAAVRDLHAAYPGRYLTDVRTACADLWENNPYVTRIRDNDPEAKLIKLDCKLINTSNTSPYHYIHAFIDSINRLLGLRVKPTQFHGDIHLSAQEKTWYSQVHEVARRDIPFWIISAGGKFDVTIKWWDPRRYQQVVDHFRGRIQFVQVGEWGHWHPPLKGVIDLRGQTNLRELVRLVYHSQGVLCPVTGLMHLAAAVETKPGNPPYRPCVVIAGGREPAHWEAYPHHQFIHRNGALTCAAKGGCWKDRVRPLGDGDARDEPQHLCAQPLGNLPRCMDMISAEEVICRIETYFDGGALHYLSPAEVRAAKRALRRQLDHGFDDQPLSLQSAGLACANFEASAPQYPGTFSGRGIVIPAGGLRYLPAAWVCIKMLRHLGCKLPIEVWHNGKEEMDAVFAKLLCELNAVAVDAKAVQKNHPIRRSGGWELKPYAMLHSRFRELLLLDADNVPVANPEYLFETPRFKQSGAIFWPDYHRDPKADVVWKCLGLNRPQSLEFESGQIIVDKEKCWHALQITMWLNENSDFFYQHLYGDKETFHLGFERAKKSYALIPHPIHSLDGTMCQHDFEGRRLFQHRNMDKWNFHLLNKTIHDFRFESECRDYMRELQCRWDAGAKKYFRKLSTVFVRRTAHPKIIGTMISCRKRDRIRALTLDALSQTDWGRTSLSVQMDNGQIRGARARQTRAAFEALRTALRSRFDFLLFLEDDLSFNQNLLHNLHSWRLLRDFDLPLGSLYNPGLKAAALDAKSQTTFVLPESIYGSQAFIISRNAVKRLIEAWDSIEGMQDIRISRIAGGIKSIVTYHTPSLVQHQGKRSVWGGHFHTAADFDPAWRNEGYGSKELNPGREEAKEQRPNARLQS